MLWRGTLSQITKRQFSQSHTRDRRVSICTLFRLTPDTRIDTSSTHAACTFQNMYIEAYDRDINNGKQFEVHRLC